MKTHCDWWCFTPQELPKNHRETPPFSPSLATTWKFDWHLRVGERLDGSNSTELCPTDVDNKYARCTFSGIIYMQIYLYIFLQIHHIYIILHLYHQRHNDISLITSISYNFYIYFWTIIFTMHLYDHIYGVDTPRIDRAEQWQTFI